MILDTDKIKELYGQNIFYKVKDYIEDITANMNYLSNRGIKNVYHVLETNLMIFIQPEDIFQEKTNQFFERLGVEYIEKLENDMTLWEQLE